MPFGVGRDREHDEEREKGAQSGGSVARGAESVQMQMQADLQLLISEMALQTSIVS